MCIQRDTVTVKIVSYHASNILKSMVLNGFKELDSRLDFSLEDYTNLPPLLTVTAGIKVKMVIALLLLKLAELLIRGLCSKRYSC